MTLKANFRKWVCLSIMLLMSGCSSEPVEMTMIDTLKSIPFQDGYAFTNHRKPYYNYYLPMKVGRKISTPLSEVFEKDGYAIVMNFKPSAVITDAYYRQKLTEEEQNRQSEALKELVGHVTYRKETEEMVYSGHYQMLDESVYPYECRMILNDDDSMVVALTSKYMDGYCVVPKVLAPSYAKLMIRMVSAVEINQDKVLKDFSLQEAIQADEENEEALIDTFGEEGYLVDLNNRETNTPD